MLLLGTTDTLYEGDPSAAVVDGGDVDRVLADAAVAVDPDVIGRDRIRATYCGLRVLPLGHGGTVDARRETVYSHGPGAMLTVAGGKLTTYRRIALDVLRALRAELGLHRVDTHPWPLPGAQGLERVRLPIEVPAALRGHLVDLYGSLAADVLEPAVDRPELLEPIAAGAPDIAAQAVYAARFEWSTRAEDVLRRRTTIALRGRATPEVERRVERLLAES